MTIDITTLIAVGTVIASLAAAVGALIKVAIDSWAISKKTRAEIGRIPIDVNLASVSAASSLTTQMSALLQQALIESKTLREEVSKLTISNSKKDIVLIRALASIETLADEHDRHNDIEKIECSYYVVVVAKLADIKKLLNSAINGAAKVS